MKVTKEQFIGVTYDELLALNDELLAFNDELLAENEHMRLKNLAVMGELCDENELLKADNAKLRELVEDMWRDGMCECDERGACAECEYHFPDRMRELGMDE